MRSKHQNNRHFLSRHHSVLLIMLHHISLRPGNSSCVSSLPSPREGKHQRNEKHRYDQMIKYDTVHCGIVYCNIVRIMDTIENKCSLQTQIKNSKCSDTLSKQEVISDQTYSSDFTIKALYRGELTVSAVETSQVTSRSQIHLSGYKLTCSGRC